MDEQKLAKARHLIAQIALELEGAAVAARQAATVEREQAWVHVQQLYTRFDEASQLLRDMRRTVDEAFSGPRS